MICRLNSTPTRIGRQPQMPLRGKRKGLPDPFWTRNVARDKRCCDQPARGSNAVASTSFPLHGAIRRVITSWTEIDAVGPLSRCKFGDGYGNLPRKGLSLPLVPSLATRTDHHGHARIVREPQEGGPRVEGRMSPPSRGHSCNGRSTVRRRTNSAACTNRPRVSGRRSESNRGCRHRRQQVSGRQWLSRLPAVSNPHRPALVGTPPSQSIVTGWCSPSSTRHLQISVSLDPDRHRDLGHWRHARSSQKHSYSCS
jgi:hypothetical protein